MSAIDEFISQYPTIKIEDGYNDPPTLQTTNDESVWVRGKRQTDHDMWFMVDDKINEQLIYPGNVILVDKDKKFTRNMVEIPYYADERKNLMMDAKYSNEISDGREIVSFTRAGVNAYVSRCLTNFKKGSHDLASNSRWEYRSSNRVEGITLGGTIKSVSFSAKMSRNKTVTVAYMKQIMYTVSLDNTLSNPSDIFTDKVDINKFKSNIQKGGGGTPAIIDAVRYGRIITIWIEQEGNEAPSISVDKYFTLSAGRTNDTTKYHVRIYGGVAGDQQFALDTSSEDELKKTLSLLKEASKEAMEGAMPMEYSLKYLNNLTTNIEWHVLPYFLSRVRQVKMKIIDNNQGASFRVYVNALKYELRGDKYGYYKWESPKWSLDTEFYLPPRTLCIDIKVDTIGDVKDKSDFNIMIPCIPLDYMDGPNSNGDWEFVVKIQGTTLNDTKKFQCTPNQPGTIISKDNRFWMNHFGDSPMNMYNNNTTVSEKTVLDYYYDWFFTREHNGYSLQLWTNISGKDSFRPVRRVQLSEPVVDTRYWDLIYKQESIETYCNGIEDMAINWYQRGLKILDFTEKLPNVNRNGFRLIFSFEPLDILPNEQGGPYPDSIGVIGQGVLRYNGCFGVFLESRGNVILHVRRNNSYRTIGTNLTWKKEEEQLLDIVYDNGRVSVNGVQLQSGMEVNWIPNNSYEKDVLSTNWLTPRTCFHGYIKNVRMYNKK